ncbi:MAG: radical SAM family heme chaperone HemW [Candidatus Zixiibacteriota bacterium]
MTASGLSINSVFKPYPGPLALYVHFPFCDNLCDYCDFFKVKYSDELAQRYYRALLRETEMVLSAFEQEPVEISSIYIGGGTPTLFDTQFLEKWISLVGGFCTFSSGFEFSIETNPESLTAAFAEKTFRLGANRIIIGIQSFDEKSLKKLGRSQNSKNIYQAFYNARMAGYKNIGADLIFGLPGQTMKKLRGDIDRVLALEPNHISFYQLTVEPGTALERKIKSGKLVLPGEDKQAQMYRLGSHILMDRKYARYEVSNFAPEEFRCRQNISYWDGSPYIGLGPAAHGYINNHRYHNVSDIDSYLNMIEEGRFPIAGIENLSREQKFTETVMLSLRTNPGIDKKKLLREFGERALELLEGKIAAAFINDGFLEIEDNRLCLTDSGFLLADKIIEMLLYE